MADVKVIARLILDLHFIYNEMLLGKVKSIDWRPFVNLWSTASFS